MPLQLDEELELVISRKSPARCVKQSANKNKWALNSRRRHVLLSLEEMRAFTAKPLEWWHEWRRVCLHEGCGEIECLVVNLCVATHPAWRLRRSSFLVSVTLIFRRGSPAWHGYEEVEPTYKISSSTFLNWWNKYLRYVLSETYDKQR